MGSLSERGTLEPNRFTVIFWGVATDRDFRGGTVDEVVGVVHYRQALAVDPDERDRTPVRDIAAAF